MALVDITLSGEQAEGTESFVATWFKQVGEAVRENEPLLEISTDKVSVEIASPATGVLREILKQEGDQFEPGDILGRIEAGTTAESGAPSPAAPAADSSPVAAEADQSAPAVDPEEALSPAVRRLLRKHGLEASAIAGTGRGGRITAEDVEAHLASKPAGRAPAPRSPSRIVPHSQMRLGIARHMTESMRAAPHVTSVFEADLGAVLAHRESAKPGFAEQGVRLTLTAYFVRAAVEAIREVPEANASWRDDGLEIWEEIHVGIATALDDGGLIVPVVRNAQSLDLPGTARALEDLTGRARSGGLKPADVQGGTFTISNHGVSGSLVATPIIINQPQSAILGVGKLQQRAVVRDGAVIVRPMAYVSLTIDHRVLDGHSANRFLTRLVEVLEGWT